MNSSQHQDCDESISVDPSLVKPHLKRADALSKKGRWEEAWEAYRRVVRMEPGCQEARRGEGICGERAGGDRGFNGSFHHLLAYDSS